MTMTLPICMRARWGTNKITADAPNPGCEQVNNKKTATTDSPSTTAVTFDKTMKSILSFSTLLQLSLLLLIVNMVSSIQLQGSYRLEKGVDNEMSPITIPNEDAAGFIMQLSLSSAEDNNNSYDLGIKIGNSLGASLSVVSEQNETAAAIKVGFVRSTMMMPPEPLFKLEMALSDMLPSMTQIELNTNDDTLVMSGAKGSLEFKRVKE